MLEAKGLSKSFDSLLFSDLSLMLQPGQSLAVLGTSGCGKSTLLHILSTLLRPDSGQVLFDGRDLYALSEAERLVIRRREFGIIFQQHYLFKGFSAYENIELASVLTGEKIDSELLEQLGIASVLKNTAAKLSGGEQQRVSIARVLCKKPRVIFADEPTGNLDAANARAVMDLLLNYARKQSAALFLITHDASLAAMCDDVLHLNQPPQK